LWIRDDRQTGAVAKSAVLVQQRFVSISINILIYKGIIKNLLGLLFENNFVKAADGELLLTRRVGCGRSCVETP
jgi:hypothetical protein